MYESKETSVRSVVVTILLIILVICVLIWILPTKKDIKNISGSNNEVLLNEVFARNLRVLQNAGRAYYYSATTPKNVGDSTTVSMNDLINNKWMLELKDKNGKTCNKELSYVQLTKKADNLYEMKSYLSCDEGADYIVLDLGCSDLKNGCKSDNNNKKDNSKNDSKDDKKESEDKKDNKESSQAYYYRYLYSCPKTTEAYSNWSNWSTTYVSSTSKREVDTKVEYKNEYVKVGTKQEPVTTYETVKTTESKEETKRYVNTKPANAISCVTLPRTGYTLYECKVLTTQTVEKEVPRTTYNTVDVYDWRETPVTYYRYRTLTNKTTYYEVWSTNSKDATYNKQGCTIIKSEKVVK